VLVYLANTEEVASRDIEHGLDIRQPEVSAAMGYLTEKKWVSFRENRNESKGAASEELQTRFPHQRDHRQYRKGKDN
jgi:predicted transcriptional regulator